MKYWKIKREIKNEGKYFYPDLREKVYNFVGYKGEINNYNYPVKKLSFTFALSIMVVIITISFILPKDNMSLSYVSLNYNSLKNTDASQVYSTQRNTANQEDAPVSVEFAVEENKVNNMRGLTIDGSIILEGNSLQLINSDVEEALVDFIESSIDLNYIDTSSKTSLYLTVINESNQKTEDNLKSKTKLFLDNYFKNNNYTTISVEINSYSEEQYQLAEKYKVTCGKLKLIEKAMEKDQNLTFEEALKYDVKKLNEITSEYDFTSIEEKICELSEVLVTIYKNKDYEFSKLLSQFQRLKNQALDVIPLYENRTYMDQYHFNYQLTQITRYFESDISAKIIDMVSNDFEEEKFKESIETMFNDLYSFNEKMFYTKVETIITGYKLLLKYDEKPNKIEFPYVNLDPIFDLEVLEFSDSEAKLCCSIIKINTFYDMFYACDKFSDFDPLIESGYDYLINYINNGSYPNIINTEIYNNFLENYKNLQ